MQFIIIGGLQMKKYVGRIKNIKVYTDDSMMSFAGTRKKWLGFKKFFTTGKLFGTEWLIKPSDFIVGNSDHIIMHPSMLDRYLDQIKKED